MKPYKIVDPTREKLMQLYIEQISQVERLLLAIDHTAWLRPHAPTLKERTYEHQPTAWCLTAYLLVSVKDIVRSHAIPTISGSWALPLRHERITSWDNPIGKGALTIGTLCVHIFSIDRSPYLIVSMGVPLW